MLAKQIALHKLNFRPKVLLLFISSIIFRSIIIALYFYIHPISPHLLVWLLKIILAPFCNRCKQCTSMSIIVVFLPICSHVNQHGIIYWMWQLMCQGWFLTWWYIECTKCKFTIQNFMSIYFQCKKKNARWIESNKNLTKTWSGSEEH